MTAAPFAFASFAGRAPIPPATLAFVLCIEGTKIEAQAVRLCRSIRMHTGAYADAAIYAVCPRPAFAPSAVSRARLAALNVRYVEADLNRTGSPYLPINRIIAGSWAERSTGHEFLVLLDSDTLFLQEPTFPTADAGIRPVDTRGSTTTAVDDPFHAYWRTMASFGNLALEQLPFVRTTISGDLVRASFNGGFAVVRVDRGVLQATEQIFMASLARDLRPLRGLGLNIHASTGKVGFAASEFWGSSQAALSVAIWASARDVILYPDGYNVPLHLLVNTPPADGLARFRSPTLLHYHWLGDAEHRAALRSALAALGVSEVLWDPA